METTIGLVFPPNTKTEKAGVKAPAEPVKREDAVKPRRSAKK